MEPCIFGDAADGQGGCQQFCNAFQAFFDDVVVERFLCDLLEDFAKMEDAVVAFFCQDFKAQILTKMVIDVLDEMSDQSDVLCFRGIIMGTVVAVVIEKGAELMEKSPLVNLIPMLEPPAAHALQESWISRKRSFVQMKDWIMLIVRQEDIEDVGGLAAEGK